MQNRAQIPIRELVILGFAIAVVVFLVSVFTAIFSSLSSGNVQASTDTVTNAFIPLMIFAIGFEIFRRFFR